MMNIILDFDGTIHDCGKIYVPAFRIGYKYLTDKGFAQPHEYSDSEITSYLGFTVKEMWRRFMPDLADEQKDICGKIIADEMTRLTECGKAKLYNGAEAALAELKNAGHRLIFLSNCMRSYMEMHRKAHDLDRFYSNFYCTEDFGFKSKPDIFKEIRGNFDGEFIVVGDRFLDLEIADVYSLKSIGCLYGYGEKGELNGATITIKDVSELPEAIGQI
ncbi:MAG: HAD hydrolase-like protein [Clostridium sp.]|nr:HAD hydrolase-like protein [Clostridium sp.]